MTDFVIRRITWQETIPLRHAVLWPGRDPSFTHVDGDEQAWHFGGYWANELVSVASVYPDGNRARLRKFATAVAHQSQGLGTTMITHILAELRAHQIDYFWCDARETAIGFYRRFGMEPYGERFYKGEVPYFKMSVHLLKNEEA